MADEKKTPEVEEQKQPTVEELLDSRTKQLQSVDSAIITCQRLVEVGNVKVVDNTTEEDNPLTLSVNGQDMVRAMINPTLNKLYNDRGRISLDLDQLKAMQQSQAK